MTTLAKLQAQKQQLIEELQGDIGPEERNQIERLLEQIDAALDSLDEAGPAVLPRPR
jgi:DNA-binding MarR family transcriptional regulator